jgi:hypothetical protein
MTGGQLTTVLQRLDECKNLDDVKAVHAELDRLRPTGRQYNAIARGVYRTCTKLGLDADAIWR